MQADVLLREEQLEQDAKTKGAHRERKLIQKAIEKGRAAETPAGVAMIKRAVEPVANAIREAVTDAKSGRPGPRQVSLGLLDHVDPEVAAYIALRMAINAARTRKGVTSTAITIGAGIEEEVRLTTFEGTEPGLYSYLMRKLRERGANSDHAGAVMVYMANRHKIVLPSFTRNEKTHLGVKLLDLIMSSTGFIERADIKRGKHTHAVITLTDDINVWADQFNMKSEFLRPIMMPMVVEPRPWEGPSGGGYMTSAIQARPLVKRASTAHWDFLRGASMPVVYRGLNAIQATAWKINTRVLEVMQQAWERDDRIALPNREDLTVPDKTGVNVDNPEELKKWKLRARDVHEQNAKSRGRRLDVASMLSAAEEMKEDPEIFFPHDLDFRGRGYAMPWRLTPQGSDPARALLTFAHGKPIDTHRAEGWLAITGANLFGFDKASLPDRIDWVTEHEAQIIAAAADPLRETWWSEADKPWSFLAWCFEYSSYLNVGPGYVSSFPLSVDGSCNGLQHFSAMLRDPIGGAAVNLVPTELPSDIYQRVADRVIEQLREAAAGEDYALAQQAYSWLAFGIDRKLTKRPVMVLPYGGTFRSCLAYVREAVKERIERGEENPFGEELRMATAYLAKLVWSSIGDVVVAARTAMKWLQDVARIATRHGCPLNWTAPSGFPAHQAYRNMKHRRVKTRLQGSLVYLSTQEETDKLDPGEQALGISPNFVHSMDASAMMLTIDLALDNGVTQFAMIHDSYGTVAADMDMLSACLRTAFVRMYQEHNVLEEFLAGLPPEVRAECPLPPSLGSLDISGVLDSEFFFA